MAKTLNYNGKPMELHVGNFRSHPTCMSLTGTTEGIFGMQKNTILIASLCANRDDGQPIGLYQGYLDASNNRNYKEIKRMLEDSGLAKPFVDKQGNLSQTTFGGYTFTLYNFDKNKLREYDLQGCQTYENNYNRAYFISGVSSTVNQRMEQSMSQNDSYHA